MDFYCASQDSDTIKGMLLDPETGILKYAGMQVGARGGSVSSSNMKFDCILKYNKIEINFYKTEKTFDNRIGKNPICQRF